MHFTDLKTSLTLRGISDILHNAGANRCPGAGIYRSVFEVPIQPMAGLFDCSISVELRPRDEDGSKSIVELNLNIPGGV